MAITLGNTTAVSASPFAHNNDGNFVSVSFSSTTNNISSVMFNSIAMTQVGSVQSNAGGRFITTWNLLNAPTGTFNISFTGGGSIDGEVSSAGGVYSYDSSAQNSGNSGTGSVTVTTISNNAYVHGFCFNSNTGTASTNTSLQGSASYRAYYYSTNAVSPAGSLTLNVTFTSNQWNFTAYALNPVPTTKGNFLAFM